jgi:transposase
LREKWVFLQDNDPKHKARGSLSLLQELCGTRQIAHPPNSPDLNPVEDIWSYLDRKVKAKKIKSIAALKRFLIKEWKELPWTEIRKSVDSMPRRLEECRKLQGKRTKY